MKSNSQIKISTVLLLAGILSLPPGLAWSAKPPELEISNKKRDLEKVQAELERKKKEQEALEKEAEDLVRKLREEQSRIQQIEKSLVFTLQKNNEVQSSLAQTKNEFDNQNILYGEKEQRYQAGIQSFYLASALAGPGSPAAAYGAGLVVNQNQNLSAVDQKRNDMRRALGELMETSQVYQTEIFKQKGQVGDLRNSVSSQETRLKKNLTKREVIENELKDLERTSRELAGLIDLLRQKAATEEKEEAERRKKNILAGKSPIPAASLAWPIRGQVVQAFGRQKHPDFGTPFISNGIKIRTKGKQTVRVVSGGTVLYVGNFMSYGPMVVVEHPDDWFSVYGNLGSWAVEKGQIVRRGDTAGYSDVGEGGQGEVYFELRFYGKPTNPVPWLEKP